MNYGEALWPNELIFIQVIFGNMFSFNRIYFNTGVILLSLSSDYQTVLNCVKCNVKYSKGTNHKDMFILMPLLRASLPF